MPDTYTVTVEFKGCPYGRSSYDENLKVTKKFTIRKLKVNLKAEIDDIELGQSPVMHVVSEEGLTGNITIVSNFSDEVYPFDAGLHSSFSVNFNIKPAPGNYYCLVSYSGDRTHDFTLHSYSFNVNKHDPNFSVQADDIVEGDKVRVKFHVDRSLNCSVNYTVLQVPSTSSDSSLKLGTTHAVRLVNGQAYAVLDNNLGPGRYFVSADCEGDDKYKEAHASTQFKINPA